MFPVVISRAAWRTARMDCSYRWVSGGVPMSKNLKRAPPMPNEEAIPSWRILFPAKARWRSGFCRCPRTGRFRARRGFATFETTKGSEPHFLCLGRWISPHNPRRTEPVRGGAKARLLRVSIGLPPGVDPLRSRCSLSVTGPCGEDRSEGRQEPPP